MIVESRRFVTAIRAIFAVLGLFAFLAIPALADRRPVTAKPCITRWTDDADRHREATCIKNDGQPAPLPTDLLSSKVQMTMCTAKWDAMKNVGTIRGPNYRQFMTACLGRR